MEEIVKIKRDTSFDILRGLGIILMVMGHVGFGDYFNHYIYAFHMPLFFFVSGYFYRKNKYDNYFKYLLHDLKTLIVPYVVFFLICQPLHYIWTGHFDIKYAILSFFTSNHNRIDVAGGYWFLLCLFTAKQIFYFLQKIKFEWVKIAILLVFACVAPLFNNQIQFILPLCLDSALVCLPIMYLGYKLKEGKETKFVKKILSLPWYFALIGLVINGLLIFLNASVNVRANHYGIIPLFWLNVITAIYLWFIVCRAIANSKCKAVDKIIGGFCYIGKNSITFFALNELTIFAVATVFSLLPTVGGVLYYLVQFIIFIISMLILALANFIIEKTKIFKWVIGK